MTYKVELVHTHEGYAVSCLDLPDCKSQGETEAEALGNIKSAISDYLTAHPQMEAPIKKIRYIEVPLPAEFEARMTPSKPFKVVPIQMGMPPGGSYDKIEDLLDLLEGPNRR